MIEKWDMGEDWVWRGFGDELVVCWFRYECSRDILLRYSEGKNSIFCVNVDERNLRKWWNYVDEI